MSEAPKRWLEDSAIDPALRDALEAGRAELPSDAQLASLEARLGPLLGGPEGGGGIDPSPGGGALAAKAIGALVIAGTLAGGGAWWATREPSPERAPAPVATPASEPASESPPALPEGVDVPEELIEDPFEPVPTAPAPAPEPSFEVDAAAELALIQRAQDALRTAPAEALARTEEHRRRFGEGTLGQEREVIAIDALTRLGRAGEARARAERFHARWPRSAHGRRVEVIVGE